METEQQDACIKSECMKCRGNMSTVTHQGIEVDRCDQCGCLVFDEREHEELKKCPESGEIDAGGMHEEKSSNAIRAIQCPKTHLYFEQKRDLSSGVDYETCDMCRCVVFDAGEYKRFMKSRRQTMI